MTKQAPLHFHRMKDMPSTHLLGTGTPTCAGCGGLETLHYREDGAPDGDQSQPSKSFDI